MDSKEFEALLSDVETRLDRLRALYEQWFQGIERLEPTIPRKEIERRMQLLKRTPIRNTALRFRFQTLWQKYTTFQTYWARVARQIEEGTYRRDLLRARRRRDALRKGTHPAVNDPGLELDIEVEASMDGFEEEAVSAAVPAPPSTVRRAPPPPDAAGKAPASPPAGSPAAARAPMSSSALSSAAAPSPAGAPPTTEGLSTPSPRGAPPPPGQKAYVPPPPPRVGPRDASPPSAIAQKTPLHPSDSGVRPTFGAILDEQRMQRIYAQYVEARRKNNESIDNVRYETVAKSLKDALPKLAQKHQGKRIDFEIVIKDGRVGIKPIAR